MNTLQIFENQTALQEVRKSFCPTLTDLEFSMFVNLAKSLGANPYTREIYAIKYMAWNPETRQKDMPKLQMFCGRDFYRRKAQEQPDYDYHVCNPIFKGDVYKVVNGVPYHESSLENRGELLGAFCVIYKKNSKNPFFVEVAFNEYAQYTPQKDGSKKLNEIWGSKPVTMICKVAEAQCLRMAYQGLFGGTYDESEKWNEIYTSERNVTKKYPNEETIENMVAKFKQYQESIQDYFEGVETAHEEVNKVKKKVADLVAYIKYHYILNNEQTLQIQSAILFDDIRINLE